MESLPDFKALDRARRLLRLPEIVTLEQVKAAYHGLAAAYHPDRHVDKEKELCTKKMAGINDAYRLITGYIKNYQYIFTEKAYREQDMEYAVRRFFKPFKKQR